MAVSLAEWCKDNNHEDFLFEWDYEKNRELNPQSIARGSDKKVWWKCQQGHEWIAQINIRTKYGSSCPVCSGHALIKGVNDLQSKYPDIAKEWHPTKNGNLLPNDVKSTSNIKIWWLCPKGHSYEAKIGNRTYLNRGCPYCAGKKTLEGDNDFKTWCLLNQQEQLLKEWNYEKNDIQPFQISPHNNKKVWWKCSLGHEWFSSIGSRTSKVRPSGCPYCSNPPKRILIGFNDFEAWCYKNDKQYLLNEWHTEKNKEFSPKEITYGCGKRVWWKCSRGHEWRVSPSNRIQGTGCPICSRTQTSFPEQAIAFYLSKSFKILQRHKIKGFELDVFLEDYNVGIEYDGKFFHTENKIGREKEKNAFYKEQGFRLIRVKETKEKVGIEGDTVYYVPVKSNYLDDSFNNMLCNLFTLLKKITGVNPISNIDIVRDELDVRKQYASEIKKNSFSSIFPELVSEWDVEKNNGMTPDNFSAYSKTKVWWKCGKGHSWKTAIADRFRLGCPFCAGQRTLVGVNDLKSWCNKNMPQLLSEWNYDKNEIFPSEVSKTSNKKVWWKCSEGHEWEAVIANRVHGTRCPYCFTGNNSLKYKKSFSEWCRENGQEQFITEWNYDKNGLITPDNVSKASHKKVWWKCSKGHEWEAQIKSRTYRHGCPYCSGTYKKAQVGINDLVTWCEKNNKHYILDEWDYSKNDSLTPIMFTFASHKLINWRCQNGHCWRAPIKERTKKRGNMCPECRCNGVRFRY